MSGRGPGVVLALVAALVTSAGLAAVAASGRPSAAAARSEGFQALLHGLGGGPAVDLSRCARAFDPRLDDGCPFRTSPVPAGDAYCAHGLAGLPAAP